MGICEGIYIIVVYAYIFTGRQLFVVIERQ